MPIDPGTASLAGSAISSLASLFGGNKAGKEARALRRQQQSQFDAAMDQTIQRRTADARKAGIHPLAGLGSSPGAGPTLTGAGVGAEGRAIAEAGAAAGRGIKDYALAQEAKANLVSSTALNEAQAAYWRSEASRSAATSPGTSGNELDAGLSRFPYDPKNVYGAAKYVPPEITKSKKPGVTAGVTPATTDYIFPDGRSVRTYSKDLEADEIKQVDIIHQRAIHKGSDALEWFANEYKRWKKGRDQMRKDKKGIYGIGAKKRKNTGGIPSWLWNRR